jgi:hypothetical protein
LLVTADASFRLVSVAEMARESNGREAPSWKPIILGLAGCLVLAVWLSKQFIAARPDPVREMPIAAIPETAARISSSVEGRLIASAEARPISPALNPETAAGRRSVPAVSAVKTNPIEGTHLPSAKAKWPSDNVSVQKTLPPPSYFVLSVRKSTLLASYYRDIAGLKLFEAPEIDLDEPLPTHVGSLFDKKKGKDNTAKERITERIQDILKLTKDDPDAFVRQIKERSDLSGFPFIMGDACRLPVKAARNLQSSSRSIRRSLDFAKQLERSYSSSDYSKDNGERFWERMNSINEEWLPGLEQILLAEGVSHRKLFMKNLREVKGKAATRILAQRAIFDLDSDVREAALEALKDRPPEDVEPYLMQGLRYPWQQVVFHAAEALVKLNRTDLAPAVANMLDLPDPETPFLGGPKKNQLMVRELVRVNHHRNCLLCHAPIDSKNLRMQAPLGPIPTPGEEMPSSAGVYYSFRPGENVVRADVTYLRQDFSAMMQVAYAHPWPAVQRYDFLVRVRALKDDDARMVKNRIQPEVTDHKVILVLALKALTGEDAGYSAAAWRRVLDPRLERTWRSACNK